MSGSTDDLKTFILARIADDEAMALGTGGGGQAWAAEPMRDGRPGYQMSSAPFVQDWHGSGYYPACLHVARHDPSRVLAECNAKRLMIEDCAQIIRAGDGEVGYWVHSLLIHMSRPYSDHPDYHWTWRETDDLNP